MFNKHKYLNTPEFTIIYKRLIEIANSRGKPIGYNYIFEVMKLPLGNHAAKEAGHLLGEISEKMHSAGKPMLSALVVNQQKKLPGEGFYKLAIHLKKLPPGAKDQEKKRFWEKELNAIYSTHW